MDAWEYLNVEAKAVKTIRDTIWRPRVVNDSELDDWENGPTLAEYSNVLGAEGWELFSLSQGHSPGSSPYRTHMVFKRRTTWAQQWAYFYLEARNARKHWRPSKVNNIQVDDWKKGPVLSEFTNGLGKDGWELVYHKSGSGDDSQLFIFKRPRP